MSDAQKPHAWAVQGCSRMWTGEFAESDAKAEAARCGGTCYAYPLYTAPTLTPPDGWAEAVGIASCPNYRMTTVNTLAKAILDMDKKLKDQK